MKNMTPMFPGFHLQTLRRKPRSEQQKLAEKLAQLQQKSFKQVGEIFERFVPKSLLEPEKGGVMSRQRLFSKENTFWAFFSQILDADGGCKEVIRKLQAYASLQGIVFPSSSTASYCTARKNLNLQTLTEIFEHTAKQQDRSRGTGRLKKRRVVVVDGTGVSMPDTAENQEIWPQSASQKPGCGFPTARICACFSLESGTLLSYAIANKKSHELQLFRQQWQTLQPGDIFLGDKAFCSYFDIAQLKEQGIDSVVTLARRAPVREGGSIKRLAPDDLLITWPRPKYNPKLSYSQEEWNSLPQELTLRQIKVSISYPGFRVRHFHIVTTLLDAVQYPSSELADLYFQRWDVELFFRDIKTTMGMDVLRCLSPEMVRKEILMYFIAYNCIRQLMTEAAREADIAVRTVSFKGSLQALRNWQPHLNPSRIGKVERYRLLCDLYEAITDTPLRQRPGRSEPRCRKRRPKNYELLTAPRHEKKEIPHRNRYRASKP